MKIIIKFMAVIIALLLTIFLLFVIQQNLSVFARGPLCIVYDCMGTVVFTGEHMGPPCIRHKFWPRLVVDFFPVSFKLNFLSDVFYFLFISAV